MGGSTAVVPSWDEETHGQTRWWGCHSSAQHQLLTLGRTANSSSLDRAQSPDHDEINSETLLTALMPLFHRVPPVIYITLEQGSGSIHLLISPSRLQREAARRDCSVHCVGIISYLLHNLKPIIGYHVNITSTSALESS